MIILSVKNTPEFIDVYNNYNKLKLKYDTLSVEELQLIARFNFLIYNKYTLTAYNLSLYPARLPLVQWIRDNILVNQKHISNFYYILNQTDMENILNKVNEVIAEPYLMHKHLPYNYSSDILHGVTIMEYISEFEKISAGLEVILALFPKIKTQNMLLYTEGL